MPICVAVLPAPSRSPPSPCPARPVGTGFHLPGPAARTAATPANGPYDLRCTLFDAAVGGAQVGATVVLEDVAGRRGPVHGRPRLRRDRRSPRTRAGWRSPSGPGASTGAFTTVGRAAGARPVTVRAVQQRATPWTGVSGKPAGFADNVDNDSGGTVTSIVDRRRADGRADLAGTPATSSVAARRHRPRPDQHGPGPGARLGHLPARLLPARHQRRRLGGLHGPAEPARDQGRRRPGARTSWAPARRSPSAPRAPRHQLPGLDRGRPAGAEVRQPRVQRGQHGDTLDRHLRERGRPLHVDRRAGGRATAHQLLRRHRGHAEAAELRERGLLGRHHQHRRRSPG